MKLACVHHKKDFQLLTLKVMKIWLQNRVKMTTVRLQECMVVLVVQAAAPLWERIDATTAQVMGFFNGGLYRAVALQSNQIFASWGA